MNTLEDRIRQMRADGSTIAGICSVLRVCTETVYRAIGGRGYGLHIHDLNYLDGVPTIPDEEAKHITRTGGYPRDEQATTAAIYAAAEVIRERSPRPPVGHRDCPIGIVEASGVVMGNRGGKHHL